MGIKKVQGNNKNFNNPLTMESMNKFLEFLVEHGLERKDEPLIPNPDRPQKAYTNVDNKRRLSGYYAYYDNYGMACGFCADYRTGVTHNFRLLGKSQRLNTEAIAKFKADSEKANADKHAKARRMAQKVWGVAQPVTTHRYLSLKNVAPQSCDGIKEHRGELVIPVHDGEGKIWSLQFIKEDGSKRFLSGGKISGNFAIIGLSLMKESQEVGLGEGFATCSTIFQEKNIPMIVCFNAGNLVHVGEIIKEEMPNKKFTIYADNDANNVGQDKAIKTAQKIDADVVMPEEEGMDFNDQKTLVGEVVEKKVDVPMVLEFEKTEKGRIMPTTENYEALMNMHDIEAHYDVIKKRIDINIPNFSPIADLKDEAVLVELENLCIKNFLPHQRLRDAVKIISKEHNPVADWIDSKEWDGKERITDFCNSITSVDEELKHMLMKKWLLSCVACVYEPDGVSLEGCLVLQGKQGTGKTLWFKRLADFNRGWLLEGATLDPKDKDSVKKCVSHWIVELGELEATFKKADINQLKAFITARSDEMRLPYDRSFTNYQRRTVFFASVNEPEFLMDGSGNRRFWCIKVKDINPHHNIDMQQMWQEVKQKYYKAGEKNWYLNKEERDMLQESNEGFRTQGAVEDLLLHHVDFDALDSEKKGWQLTQLLRAMGIRNPRNIDFKDASRVLTDRGIMPRKSNGKKLYDVSLINIEEEEALEF